MKEKKSSIKKNKTNRNILECDECYVGVTKLDTTCKPDTTREPDTTQYKISR